MVALLHRLSDIEDLHLVDLTAIDCCHFVLLSVAPQLILSGFFQRIIDHT
jgi:hypothetical protein